MDEHNKIDEAANNHEDIDNQNLDEAFKWTVEKFVTRKRFGVCLLSSTLLIHRLGKGKVVEGYQIFSDKTYVRHYWVRIDNRDVDVGQEINKRLSLPHTKRASRLAETAPGSDYFYLSTLDLQELQELEEGYQLYIKKPKAYWKLVGTHLGWLRRLVLKKNILTI